MSFIAGPYTWTYDGATIGSLHEGYTLHAAIAKETITGDNQGERIQDAVYLGEDVTGDLNLMEWDQAKAILLYWPYSATWLTGGQVGRLDVQQSLVKSLVGTAVAGPPAANQPATITLPRTILHENFPVDHLLRARHRRVPIRMRHYPDSSSVYGTTT